MDSVVKQRLVEQPPLPFKARLLGVIAMMIIRCMGLGIRFKVDDPDKVAQNPNGQAIIWALWHNRIFALPLIYKRLIPQTRGAVLTSPSRDGNYLAGLALALGVCSIRGSSSKRGARALVEMRKWLQDGFTLGITPDGPRGPRYELAPGIIKLSQVSDCPIATMHIDYSRYWTVFKSWDRFRIPQPFSTIYLTMILNEPVDPKLDEAGFEKVRQEIEKQLNPHNEID